MALDRDLAARRDSPEAARPKYAGGLVAEATSLRRHSHILQSFRDRSPHGFSLLRRSCIAVAEFQRFPPGLGGFLPQAFVGENPESEVRSEIQDAVDDMLSFPVPEGWPEMRVK